jgi:hypothetical protein
LAITSAAAVGSATGIFTKDAIEYGKKVLKKYFSDDSKEAHTHAVDNMEQYLNKLISEINLLERVSVVTP